MANEKNLIPACKRSLSETRENGKKGGIKSGEKRREKKALKETLQTLLESNYDVDGRTVSGAEAAGIALIQQALKGNVKAYEVIRDTVGEKPTVSVSVNADDETRRAYERAASAIKGVVK